MFSIIFKDNALIRSSIVPRENFSKAKHDLTITIGKKKHLVKADLIRVQFDINEGHPLIDSVILPRNPVYCFWDKLKNKIEIKLIPFSC